MPLLCVLSGVLCKLCLDCKGCLSPHTCFLCSFFVLWLAVMMRTQHRTNCNFAQRLVVHNWQYHTTCHCLAVMFSNTLMPCFEARITNIILLISFSIFLHAQCTKAVVCATCTSTLPACIHLRRQNTVILTSRCLTACNMFVDTETAHGVVS